MPEDLRPEESTKKLESARRQKKLSHRGEKH